MIPRYRHIIFDLDGTLADTCRDLAAAANHVRRTRGLADMSATEVCAFVGEGARRLVERVLPGASGAEIEAALSAFLGYYAEHLLDETVLYDGIDELLAALTIASITCSVLSNKPEKFCRSLIDGLGLSSRFACIVGGDSLSARKPDPSGVEHVRALTGIERAALLLVGDSSIDLRTASAAGVDFCGVTWGFAPASLATSAPRQVSTPMEILALALHGDPKEGDAPR